MTKTTLAAIALAAALAAGPAAAAVEGFEHGPPPEFGAAATYRLDHAGSGPHHWPSCLGLSSGTAHHSCGSLTGGPAGGLN